MVENKRHLQISAIIEPVIKAMGYEFVGCELSASGHYSKLRIYIDKPDGVILDDCSKVSRQIGAVLDVEDPISSHYTLEVSSPGLNRPLFTKGHFKRFIGQKASVRLQALIEGQRNFIGVIVGVKGDQLILTVDDEEIKLPMELIAKANLVEAI
jgi:ribosome maturation factor RimP